MSDVMVLNEKEKEAVVIDLLNKGHTTREISKMANVSNTTTKKIRQKITKDDIEEKNEPKKKPLSISSQAFNLFLEGKSIVQVAIGLDLPTDQVLKIHSDYLTLQNRQKIVSILVDNGNNPKLLETLHYPKENRIGLKDFKDIVDIKKEIGDLKMERDKLEWDNFNAEETLKYRLMDINKIQNKRYNQQY